MYLSKIDRPAIPVMDKLLAVYLGGRAATCNTELHDVVFVAGPSIEATYDELLDKWFGDPLSLHIDSWVELNHVDGYRISLSREPATQPERLFFVNLGGYRPGEFTELHANAFLVGQDERDVKRRAKAGLLRGVSSVHTDDLFDVDDCLTIAEVDGRHVHLEPAGPSPPLAPNSAYHVIPENVLKRHALRFPRGPA